jgi:hypothetical protein
MKFQHLNIFKLSSIEINDGKKSVPVRQKNNAKIITYSTLLNQMLFRNNGGLIFADLLNFPSYTLLRFYLLRKFQKINFKAPSLG